MASPTIYKNKDEAEKGLSAAFGPTNDAQQQAIAHAASLVPTQTPQVPVPSPIKIKRTIDPSVQAAESYLGTFTKPQSQAQIAEEMRRASQALIDSINKVHDDQVAQAKKVGDERLAMDNAVSVLSGLTGSTEAGRTRGKTLEANEKEIAAINNQRGLELSRVYTKITQDARDEARRQKEDATKSAEDILKRRTESQAKAVENLKLMAQGGLVDFESFKASPQNSEVYNYALDAVGGSEEALKGLFAMNRPKESVIERKYIGNKLYQIYEHPLTGAIRSEMVDLGFEVPPNYTTEVDLGDRIMLLDPSNPDKKLVFAKGLTPSQQATAAAAGSADPQQAQATIDLVKSALASAKELASASGRSGARRAAEAWFVGSTDYSNLVAQTNTLKTNVLTLIGDPTIKKFFGPQMSNADVTLMTSAGTTLNPELQSPEQMKSELTRLEDLIGRMDAAVQSGTSATGSDRVTVIAPDGSSGTIPRSQLQEALNAGYRQQ